MSFIAQRLQGIDAGGAACREVAGEKNDRKKKEGGGAQGENVKRREAVEQTVKAAADQRGAGEADGTNP